MKPWQRAMLTMVSNNPLAYTNKVVALSPIAYWPMAESSGSTALDASGNARNGAYTGVTLGQPGIGDGRTAAGFDGATSFNNIFSASLAGAFSGAAGTLALWAQVSGAGVWSDGTQRRFVRLNVDASNYVLIYRTAINNQIACEYSAGGTIKTRTISSISSTGWIHIAITWSASNDQVIAYLNGAQQGATLTGLGVFAGSLVSGSTVVGATTTVPALVWSGNLAHAAIFSSALSAAQVLSLATVP